MNKNNILSMFIGILIVYFAMLVFDFIMVSYIIDDYDGTITTTKFMKFENIECLEWNDGYFDRSNSNRLTDCLDRCEERFGNRNEDCENKCYEINPPDTHYCKTGKVKPNWLWFIKIPTAMIKEII